MRLHGCRAARGAATRFGKSSCGEIERCESMPNMAYFARAKYTDCYYWTLEADEGIGMPRNRRCPAAGERVSPSRLVPTRFSISRRRAIAGLATASAIWSPRGGKLTSLKKPPIAAKTRQQFDEISRGADKSGHLRTARSDQGPRLAYRGQGARQKCPNVPNSSHRYPAVVEWFPDRSTRPTEGLLLVYAAVLVDLRAMGDLRSDEWSGRRPDHNSARSAC
jgi:hypothetical protein